jgi:hypothetical protein
MRWGKPPSVMMMCFSCEKPAMLRMSPQTFRLYEKAGHIKVTNGPHRHSP